MSATGCRVVFLGQQSHVDDLVPMPALQVAKLFAQFCRGPGPVARFDGHGTLDDLGECFGTSRGEIGHRCRSDTQEVRDNRLAFASFDGRMPGNQTEQGRARP